MSTYSVEHSTKDIQSTLKNDPANARSVFKTLIAVNAQPVEYRHDSR